MRNSSVRLIVLIAAMLLVAVFAGGTAVAEKKPNTADAIAFAVSPILSAADVPDPAKRPDESLRSDNVQMAVCPGDVGLGSICVCAGKEPLEDVTLDISDLLGTGQKEEPADGPAHRRLSGEWKFQPDPANKGLARRWFARDLDDSDWPEIRTDVSKG